MILTFGPSKVIFSTSRVFTWIFGMILSILYFDTTQNFPKMTWASIGQNKPKYRENYEKLWKSGGNLAQRPKTLQGIPADALHSFGEVAQGFPHFFIIFLYILAYFEL